MTARHLGTLRLALLVAAAILCALALPLGVWNGLTLLALLVSLAFVASLYPKAHP